MINALYVGGDNKGLSNIAGREIKIDYVQNGMIALSAIQTGDFDAIIIEDELPLMTPSRLIQELFHTNPTIPIIGLVRTEKRRGNLLADVGMGLFGYFEPEYEQWDDLRLLLGSLICINSTLSDSKICES